MNIYMRVKNIRGHFIDALNNKEFVTDRTGQKTIELLGASFIADEDAIFGTPNLSYISRELQWYESQSTNIKDIDINPPKAWVATANEHGEINSNYGLLIHSEKYHNQFNHAMHELVKNPDSRRATVIYNRPSIWLEYNENGKNDFICTNAVTYYIRDNKVHCVVQMRSNDVVFGYKNDYAWQLHTLHSAAYILGKRIGTITWQVQNLHVYERHFDLVKHVEEPVPSIQKSIDEATPREWTEASRRHSNHYYDINRNRSFEDWKEEK